MVAFAMLAEEPFVPCFADIPSVEAARLHLHAVGVETFVAEARKANVSPPRIHSRYWVDTMPAEATEERKLEEAYRDFGLELAKQLGDRAISFFDNPDRSAETNRFAWLLAVDEWVLGSCGYSNYRISRRLEGIAGVILARIIADFSVPNAVIEKYFSMFPTDERKAVLRADILFEESRGVMDVREDAKQFSDKGNFESQWTAHLRAAFRHFDSMDVLSNYRQFRDRINLEEPKYSFFCSCFSKTATIPSGETTLERLLIMPSVTTYFMSSYFSGISATLFSVRKNIFGTKPAEMASLTAFFVSTTNRPVLSRYFLSRSFFVLIILSFCFEVIFFILKLYIKTKKKQNNLLFNTKKKISCYKLISVLFSLLKNAFLLSL